MGMQASINVPITELWDAIIYLNCSLRITIDKLTFLVLFYSQIDHLTMVAPYLLVASNHNDFTKHLAKLKN